MDSSAFPLSGEPHIVILRRIPYTVRPERSGAESKGRPLAETSDFGKALMDSRAISLSP